MQQKGFATIFGLCFILIIALIVKGIQESEANHAREILNFEMEQSLQQAAESGIIETVEKVRLAGKNAEKTSSYYLPYKKGDNTVRKSFPIVMKYFKHDEQNIPIKIEVWGERGKIYKGSKNNNWKLGVYFMSCASMESNFLSKNIYRRSYAYILSEQDADNEDIFYDDTTIYFMELPTTKDD